jgi:hypothetical protein
MKWEEQLDRENMDLKSAIMQAGRMLAEHYPDLRGEQAARPTATLLKLVEAVVSDLLAERAKSSQLKLRLVKALEDVSLLSIDVKNAYRDIKQLKGG